ncbi:hypothetical protein RUM44_002752 [Polyplax serrata]|uniref:Uncharacterized protein n=1 Tax=Polyplax serrata TaxID=468196 RepID=A0ABR1AFN6_POLSC
MRERNRNQLNNKNILLLNRAVVEPVYNVKNSSFIQITPTTSSNFFTKAELSKLIQSGDETYFDTDVEIIDDCDNDKSKVKEGGSKKETPLLQIFDGNVVISQELSIEEVQNLLHQINSKLQNQNDVNSTDFPNITFSKEENSDVEIILEDDNYSDSLRGNSNISAALGAKKSGVNWAVGSNFEQANNRKALVKALSASDQPSTSSETNLLISFKSFDVRKPEVNDFDHDYGGNPGKEKNGQKKKVVESVVEHVVVDNPETELMQIELIENGINGITATTAATPVVSSYISDKGRIEFKCLKDLNEFRITAYSFMANHIKFLNWND